MVGFVSLKISTRVELERESKFERKKVEILVEFQQRGNPTFSARRSEEEEEE